MPIGPVNLAIVDDHSLFRKTIKNYLSGQKEINVVVQASNMVELLTDLRGPSVEILLMDIFMPGLSGIEALKTLQTEYPALKIIVLSMNMNIELICEMLDFGIHGYVCKVSEPEELIEAIHTVATGRICRNRWFTAALYWKKQNGVETNGNLSPANLSEREKKFLQLLWEEKSNKEIAHELFLGVKSIEKIKQNLKEKIGVKSTIGLLKYSINEKIISGKFRSSN
jgi:DNA-binding NarL/FixJ family response regulator